MSVSLKSLGIDRLSIDEQLQLVEDIWDEIASTVESRDIPQSHKDELDRREAAYQTDPEAGSSWKDVKARLAQRFGPSS